MRQLARIVTINKLDKHPNADRLQIAQVGLWNIVTAADTHKIGSSAIMFEIDSMLPLSDERFAFLAGRKDYVINGVTYARLKTIRLRGVLSQGLLVPADLFEKEIAEFQKEDNTLSLQEILGVIKYEPPEDNFGGSNRIKNTPGDTRPFPVFIPKTDQERIQNFVYEYNAIVDKFNTNDPSQFEYFEVTYKLDGCFLYDTLIETYDGKSVKIGDIVSNQLSPSLIGVDKNGKIVPCQITNVLNSGTKKEWVDIHYVPYQSSKIVGKSGKLRTTINHKIFKSDMTEVNAADLKIDDKILMHANVCDDAAKHYIYSSLLGDGCIPLKYGQASNFTESKKSSHVEYINYLKESFGDLYSSSRNQISGFGFDVTHINTIKTYDMNSFRADWYDANGKKLPEDISWIDDFSLAKWYLDDGSLSHSKAQNDRATLATNAFSYSDNLRLKKYLEDKYKLSISIQKNKGYSLRINYSNGSISNFWDAIYRYIPSEFKYKLPEKYRNTKFDGYPKLGIVKKLIPVAVTLVNHVPFTKDNFPHGAVGFDIETSTGNYFCNGVLVHNSSITMYSAFNKLGVCSRNLEINMPYDWSDWPARESHFIKAAIDSGIMFKLAMHYSATGRSIALQGELCGPGIQSNFEGLTKHEIFIYDVYDIDAGRYMLPDERREFLVDLGIQQVPVHSYNIWLPTPIEAILEMADGPSGLNGQFREGLVFKSMERDFSFKAISNAYLESTGK